MNYNNPMLILKYFYQDLGFDFLQLIRSADMLKSAYILIILPLMQKAGE